MRIFFPVFLIALSIPGCKSNTETAISGVQKAGKNGSELEKVLRHYSKTPGDSLKYKAAIFLIKNMDDKFSYKGRQLDSFFKFCDSLSRLTITPTYYNKSILSYYHKKGSLVGETFKVKDAEAISSGYIIKNIDEAFSRWKGSPWNRDVSFEDFCDYILPYRVGNESFGDFRSHLYEKYASFDMGGCTMQMAADSILHQTNKKGIFLAEFPGSVPDFPIPVLENLAGGSCKESSNLSVYIMRSFGLPVAQDFTFQWPHRAGGHFWSALVVSKDSSIDFEGINANKTGGHILVQNGNKVAKVYRMTFGRQPGSLAMIHGDEEIPEIFQNPYFKDVSSCYFKGADVKLKCSRKKLSDRKFAYLCVFDNSKWTPIAWGRINDSEAVFTGMGRNIVYLPVVYLDGKYRPVDYPIKIDSTGAVIRIAPDEHIQRTLLLKRKYPIFDWWASRTLAMKGGRFQGSNDRNFTDAVTLYTIHESPEMKYHTVVLNNSKKYKYWRYLPVDSSYGDIAEIEFYDGQNKILNGTPIGTVETEDQNRIEFAFDKDPLTFFQGLRSVNNWVGMKFDAPQQVTKIRFLGRNDDNFINQTDRYGLFYWGNEGWKLLGTKTGTTSQSLEFKNAPGNALFLLHDSSKGKEERIFTYEHGKQVWY